MPIHRTIARLSAVILASSLAACGGGGDGGGGGGGIPPAGSTVTVSFSTSGGATLPNVVATSSGTFATWSVATLSGGNATIALPSGVSTYGVAYYCGTSETIFEASTADTSTPAFSCSSASALLSATFSYDVSAIAGATSAEIDFESPNDNEVNAESATTGIVPITNVPVGVCDVMVKALDSSKDVIAAHIFRGQSFTSGGTFALTPLVAGDATTFETITASGLPSGWTPNYEGAYVLLDGSRFFMGNGTTTYFVPGASQVLTGDYYFADAQATSVSTANEVASFVTAGAPPASLALPLPFVYAGPTPADDPAFVFSYTGSFTVSGTLLYQAEIQYGGTAVSILATKGGVGLNPTLTLPNLATTSALFPNLPHGVNVAWQALIVDESPLTLGTVIPNNFGGQFAESTGQYAAP